MPNVPFDGTLAGWRAAARALLAAGVGPDDAVWASAADAQGALALGGAGEVRAAPGGAAAPLVRVPRRFLGLAALVACHRDPERWPALYRVLWRLTLGGEPRLLAVTVDADVLRLTRMAKAVRRDVHKMHAFVRFRAAPARDDDGRDDGGDAAEFVAWFEPEHDVVARAAPFFARRFPHMRWTILTPRGTARWDGAALAFGPGVPVREGPRDDSLEALWGVYYAHIFNPARLKLAAMRAEMPKRYWRNLPEARLVDGMVRAAPARVRRMVEAAGVAAAGVDAGRPAWGGAGAAGGGADGGPPVPNHRPGGPAPAAAPPLRLEGAEVRVGTAGWAGGPDDARTPDARLRDHAARLSLVEVDATFAAFPTRTVAALWAARTPPGFVFDVRAHALLAGHPVEPRRLPRRVRDLLPPSLAGANRVMPDELPPRVREAAWDDFLGALAPLADAGRLGAVLLRLPGWLAPSRAAAAALAAAGEALGGRLAAVEFGHGGWLEPRVRGRTLALLERLGFAHTVVAGGAGGADAAPPAAEVTHPELAVVRLLGRRKEPGGAAAPYTAAELAAVVRNVAAVAGRARAVHVVVDVDGAEAGAGGAAALAASLAAALAAPDR